MSTYIHFTEEQGSVPPLWTWRSSSGSVARS